jgi:hypothetical protein
LGGAIRVKNEDMVVAVYRGSRSFRPRGKGVTTPAAFWNAECCFSVAMKRSFVSFTGIAFGTALLLAGLAWAAPAAAPGGKGTSILHFFVRKAMSNTDVTGATGRVDAKQNQQGNADNRQLDIVLKHLTPNTPYWLGAILKQDVAEAEEGTEPAYRSVGTFTTDAKGGATLRYRKTGSSQGKALGRGKLPLPADLDPLYEIRELAVLDADPAAADPATVLVADLTVPDKLQYLVKKAMTTNPDVDADALGALRVKATVSQAQFRLAAVGLTPGASYVFALNGGMVQTNAADAKGRLMVKTELATPSEVLTIEDVKLLDLALLEGGVEDNVVLSADLLKP